MNFQNYLQEEAKQINTELENFLIGWGREVEKINPKLKPLSFNFIEACRGGKRLRGMLVKLGFELAGGNNQEILKCATAVEIFQTSILAHDDIIDQSQIRRGKPTLYKMLGADHYALSQAISLGDIGLFLTVKLISECNFKEDRKVKALQEFSKMAVNTGLGEVLDIELTTLKKGEVEDVLAVYKLKTAYYTIVYPLSIGAILAGADKHLLSRIEEFGENLGIAFQIQDDILGVFGDTESLGKSVSSDIEEGKVSLLLVFAMENASKEDRQFLEKVYGKGEINKEDFEKVRKIFKDCGALDWASSQAQIYVEKAKKIIPELTSNEKQINILTQMADFLIKREN